ncbi:MAG: hypothetical protein WCG83_05735 [Candidatus Peregrinibacteria bacterium]
MSESPADEPGFFEQHRRSTMATFVSASALLLIGSFVATTKVVQEALRQSENPPPAKAPELPNNEAQNRSTHAARIPSSDQRHSFNAL